ncbi:MAG: peptidoglycan bridge formation glycyltransferase FemA/FemB family protein [Parcubacteria group bacterium]|jgi:lipid II:glycine glycyltransferase (peptidoglycan interpeptide bridge formation enzyme)
MLDSDKNNFIQANSPNGGFLQSEQWRKFQEATGKRTFNISAENFWANIVEHELPIVGKYFYIPRGPLGEGKMEDVINLAKKEKVGWIRIDVDYKNSDYKVVKAPHDMQPRELFIIDITKSEEDLLSEMKSKTRYNIKVAQKHDVKISVTDKSQPDSRKYLENFLELVKVTTKRDGITPHPENYYRQMFETIPAENLKLYIAEYKNKIITANIVIHYGNTATYLHGASDNESRNVMAPYLLQWQAILDAKKAGLARYDFGGVKIGDDNSWSGITKFKTGFSPETKPIEFSGSYDIVINPVKYNLYRAIQKIKSLL